MGKWGWKTGGVNCGGGKLALNWRICCQAVFAGLLLSRHRLSGCHIFAHLRQVTTAVDLIQDLSIIELE